VGVEQHEKVTLLKNMRMFFCFDRRVKGKTLYSKKLDGVSGTRIVYVGRLRFQ
jgi:hypothetical protein